MTDRTTRDEIAQILRETYDREFDGVGGEWFGMADALIQANFIKGLYPLSKLDEALDRYKRDRLLDALAEG